MRIRGFTPDDIEAMFQLDARCFTEPFQFDRKMMREFAETPRASVLLAEDNSHSELTGFIILHIEGPADGLYGYVVTIDVSPDHRRQGIGAVMLGRAEAAARASGAREVALHVAADNHGAIAFYKRQHYRRVGLARHFYREADQDAIVFAKAI